MDETKIHSIEIPEEDSRSMSVWRNFLRVHDKKAFDKDYKLFSLRDEVTVDFYDAFKISGE
jgi:hypothetical protein